MKSRQIADSSIKQWVVIFETGDKFMDGMSRFARENQLTASNFTAIGALQSLVLGYFDWNNKDYRKIPYSCNIQRFVKIAFARAAITIKDDGYLFFIIEFRRQSDSSSHTVLWTQMGDHPDNVMFTRTKMERPVAAFRVPEHCTLPLGEQSV